MRPDLQLLLDLEKAVQSDCDHVAVMRRARTAIIRLKRQLEATRDIYDAAKAMYESTGVTMELRDALELYDNRRRPMSKWKLPEGGHYNDPTSGEVDP